MAAATRTATLSPTPITPEKPQHTAPRHDPNGNEKVQNVFHVSMAYDV